jgi:hypothetical protein
MIIYTAGPYREFTLDGVVHSVDENIARAMKISAELWQMGHVAICPHGNTAHMEHMIDISPQQYLDGDIEIVKLCDAMVMTDYWKQSAGAVGEYDEAKRLGMPVYEYPEIPPLHPTEVRCPEQVKAFREIIGRMMRMHESKNSDYSPSNILATGQIGVTTRIWDKTARLLNLTGFKIGIDTPLTFTKPRVAKNESLNDTYMDLAVYAIIGKLLLEGKWGR